MQARFSLPSSLAAHHRRLMASCAESGCPQVRQRSGALSAGTVGESPCMSKSVKAHCKGQIVSARDLPTGCQQQCSLVVPTVRAARHLTEPIAKSPQMQPTKRPVRERSSGQLNGLCAQRWTRGIGSDSLHVGAHPVVQLCEPAWTARSAVASVTVSFLGQGRGKRPRRFGEPRKRMPGYSVLRTTAIGVTARFVPSAVGCPEVKDQ
jgi:hypothetical protein